MTQFLSAIDAAHLIGDGDTLALMGGGGGLMEATTTFQAIERRFLDGQGPHNLTLVHALGIGDRQTKGLNCFAYEDMVRRVIGGHWVWSPRMQTLARENKIEAYILPGGVTMQLFREIGAGRVGLITHVGLGTVCDPRQGGGRMNEAAQESLSELITIDGQEYIRYKPFPIQVAIIRGTCADDEGNIGMDDEAANIDAYALDLAAHNSGGRVIVQVQRRVSGGSLTARQVRIPSVLVDAVVVDPNQQTSYQIPFDPALVGLVRASSSTTYTHEPLTERTVIARRAVRLLRSGMVVNYGVGIPDQVAKLVAQARAEGDPNAPAVYQTIEHGTYGGELLTGDLFGYARGASAMIDAPSQFDFYSGGGLDIAFLGFGEFDQQGNVNVSRLGGVTVGPGGFIDIAQNARTVVFCGAFAAKGLRVSVQDNALRIDSEGQVQKVVSQVEQITFSGEQAIRRGQQVYYITERACFRLTEAGVQLFELAPGVDGQTDVLTQMGFRPVMPDEGVAQMDGSCFSERWSF